jgi:ribonucleoside-diphosphate reductase alpha chain
MTGVGRRAPCDGGVRRHLPRSRPHAEIAEAAWQCGDPGLQFDTTINDWHTCPNTARINASNPCSEYMFLDDTACNLASLNLMKFARSTASSTSRPSRTPCRTLITARRSSSTTRSYPTEKIEKNSTTTVRSASATPTSARC